MLDEIEDDDTERIEVFNDIVQSVYKECGTIKSTDRCETAFEVAKCLVKILDTDFIETNAVVGDST